MLKKFALLAAALSMVLVASLPVLAQDGYETQFDPVEGSDAVYPIPYRDFSCGFLNGDPATICEADENGFFTTPSGVRFPVSGTDNDAYRSFIQYGGVPGSELPPQPAL